MVNKKLFERLQRFDRELCDLLKISLDRQLYTLSLIPTDSAASPLSQYIKGSAIGNDFIGQFSAQHYSQIEQLAVKRCREIFGAEHAIVRTGNAAAASRVVLMTFAKAGDKILSFNLRKSEYCTGEQMRYDFIKFAVEPKNFRMNYESVRYLAMRHKPALIIYSPVNYPHNIDYKKMRAIADEVGANLWIDLGQNAGLIAAKKIPSPVPYADVATFSASDALHGPQSGIILSRKKFADALEQKLIDTGHVSLKKNVLASLAITFREVDCEEYKDYAEQILINARALEDGLKKSGAEVLIAPTENHLVLVKISQDGKELENKLGQAGLLVKAEKLMTTDDSITYPVLRLSSLDPTTRGVNEDEMFKVGATLGKFLQSRQDSQAAAGVNKVIKNIVENLPLFSEEWIPEAEIIRERDPELMMKALIYGM
ncbi:MAG: serine hydroxymethyltransferase [Selenomonadaceae bacterium]|nr:serine hydroxymethyltransferase [Selenomonadaceae bacterium]MBQ4402860.1 serine hydroxymethyltransferase [Selenomonadaceae bacterium]MBQ6132193.1 serine hydroxymethyltransferase [Selenomonadaceae bacterium]MBQ7493960.1 serine hydroxymethyltransferase [Selenomonadaceae bacterium]